MLSFIRRIIYSPIGVVITLVVLAIIAVLFAATDVSGLRGDGIANLTGTANTVATVDGEAITANELRRRVQADVENFRQQQPGLTVAQYIGGGGFEGTLERLINGLVIEKFAKRAGMVVSKKAIDAQLAAIPQLKGLDGKFDQAKYEQLIASQRMTDADVRREITRATLTEQLTLPNAGAGQVPVRLAAPYAALLLERRSGLVGFVPTRAMGAGAQPNAAELSAFYQRNRARYTIPERRIARYALVTPDQVKASAAPTAAEIAAAYRQQAARFAASEKRSIGQVVVADRAAADALAAKVKGGTPIATAARAIGLDVAKIDGVDRAAYERQANAEAAGAVFAAAQGAVIGPIKAPLGWIVARVERVEKIAGQSLDAARPILVAELTKQKTAVALSDLSAQIDEAITKNTNFAEIVADRKLQSFVTPAVIADGRDPTQPALKPDPALANIVKAAFAAEPDDDPQIVPVGSDGGFALVALERIVPAAAPPVASLREVIARDFTIDRARTAARAVALQVIAKVKAGMPLAQALKATGLTLPAPAPLDASRAVLQANPQAVPPPVAFAFTMAPKTAKLLEDPNLGGWLIVYLDRIERGDATRRPELIAAEQRELGSQIGREYVQQFIVAMRRAVGVVKHDTVIAKVRADLLGQAAGTP